MNSLHSSHQIHLSIFRSNSSKCEMTTSGRIRSSNHLTTSLFVCFFFFEENQEQTNETDHIDHGLTDLLTSHGRIWCARTLPLPKFYLSCIEPRHGSVRANVCSSIIELHSFVYYLFSFRVSIFNELVNFRVRLFNKFTSHRTSPSLSLSLHQRFCLFFCSCLRYLCLSSVCTMYVCVYSMLDTVVRVSLSHQHRIHLPNSCVYSYFAFVARLS